MRGAKVAHHEDANLVDGRAGRNASVFADDPDGNGWAVQQIPDYGEGRTQPEL